MPRDNNTDRTVRPGNAATKMSGDAWAGMAIAAALKTYGVLANRGASRRRSGQVAERSQRDSSAGAGESTFATGKEDYASQGLEA